MPELKEVVARFWNENPCGGGGVYQDRLNWIKATEGYIYEILNEDLVKGRKCLEVGCGQGFVSIHVSDWAEEVVGIDISNNSVKVANKGKQELGRNNVSFLTGDAENLEFENNSFEFVYSIGVLHHTPDTQKGINEIYRVLKPDGTAIIMLYRKYCPKGMVTSLIRKISSLIDIFSGKRFFINGFLQRSYAKKSHGSHGTALNELFGCPILKMYSKKELINMFQEFKEIKITCHQPGFGRLKDFIPILKCRWISSFLDFIDRTTKNKFGFYWVIEVRK
jgi:SAM-dependent methyltransferase